MEKVTPEKINLQKNVGTGVLYKAIVTFHLRLVHKNIVV